MLRAISVCFGISLFFCLPQSVSAIPELSLLSRGTGTSGMDTSLPQEAAVEKPISEQLQEANRLSQEAQTTFTRMQSPETQQDLSLAGLPATLQSELEVAAGNSLRNFQRYAENLKALQRFKKNSEARQALMEANQDQGLENTEVALVQDRLHSTQQALKAAQSELQILADSTQESASSLPKLEQTLRQASNPSTEADRWHLTLAKLRKTETESLILANDARKKLLLLRIGALQTEVASDKKLLQTEATTIPPGQSSDALARLEKERSEMNRQIQAASQRDQAAQTALDQARKNYLQSRDTGKNTQWARQQYDLAQTEAETAEGIVEANRIHFQILDIEAAHWKYIAKLQEHISPEEVQKGMETLRRRVALLRKWRPQLEQEVRSKQTALESLKRRLEETTLPASERNFLKKKLKLLREQMHVQQRLLWQVETFHWQLSDWKNQLTKMAQSQAMATPHSWYDELGKIGSGLFSIFGKIIHYEVFHFKDTAIISGNQVTVGESSVTVIRIVLALFFFLLGFYLFTKWSRRIVRWAQAHFEFPATRMALLEKFLLYSMTALLVLGALTWARIPLTIFAFFGGALAIGVGFGAQNLINNFISGIILLFERQINIGDLIQVDGSVGRVVALGNRCARLERYDGVEMLVPNSLLLEKNVVNWTLSDLDHRFEFRFSVAYGSPIEKVLSLVHESFRETPHLLSTPEPCVFFEEFGESGLIFGVYYWVKFFQEFDPRQVGSDLRMQIERRCRAEGIKMPFPQRDLHLDAPVRIRMESHSS